MKKLTLTSLGLCALITTPAFATGPSGAAPANPPVPSTTGSLGAEGTVPPSSAEMGATSSDRAGMNSAASSQKKRRMNSKSATGSRRQGSLTPDSDLNRGVTRTMRDSSGAVEDRGTTQGADAAGDWRRRTGEPLDDRSGPMNTPQPSDPVSGNMTR